MRSNCGVYIHGHTVGGTNPSLVEAMNLGLCCLVFDVDYNRVTTLNSAIYFKDENELINILNQFENGLINSDKIGSDLYKIACDKYTWKSIIYKYDQVFENIITN